MKKQLFALAFLLFALSGVASLNTDSTVDWAGSSPSSPSSATPSSSGSLFAVWISNPLGKGNEYGLSEAITFEGDSFGAVREWVWAFGDGKTGTGKKVSHKFDSPGEKKVVLTGKASDTSLGQSSDEITIKIVEGTPVRKACQECKTVLECLGCLDQMFIETFFK